MSCAATAELKDKYIQISGILLIDLHVAKEMQ
jgi:hypothetical protein